MSTSLLSTTIEEGSSISGFVVGTKKNFKLRGKYLVPIELFISDLFYLYVVFLVNKQGRNL